MHPNRKETSLSPPASPRVIYKRQILPGHSPAQRLLFASWGHSPHGRRGCASCSSPTPGVCKLPDFSASLVLLTFSHSIIETIHIYNLLPAVLNSKISRKPFIICWKNLFWPQFVCWQKSERRLFTVFVTLGVYISVCFSAELLMHLIMGWYFIPCWDRNLMHHLYVPLF